MGEIMLDEDEFLATMKKLNIEVSGAAGEFKLYRTGDVSSKGNKIRILLLKYKPASK
jgi:hypothetical protein